MSQYSAPLAPPIVPQSNLGVGQRTGRRNPAMPPIAPMSQGYRPDVGINIEHQAQAQLEHVGNTAFNQWYGAQKPTDIVRFAPPDDASSEGINMSQRPGTPLTVDEIAGRQRASARAHFNKNVAATLPEYQTAQKEFETARAARQQMMSVQDYQGRQAVNAQLLNPPIDPKIAMAERQQAETERHNRATEGKGQGIGDALGAVGNAIGTGVSSLAGGIKDIVIADAKTAAQQKQHDDDLAERKRQFDLREGRLGKTATALKPPKKMTPEEYARAVKTIQESGLEGEEVLRLMEMVKKEFDGSGEVTPNGVGSGGGEVREAGPVGFISNPMGTMRPAPTSQASKSGRPMTLVNGQWEYSD